MDLLSQQLDLDSSTPDVVDECGLSSWEACAMANAQPPRWPNTPSIGASLTALHTALQGSYSVALYGEAGRMPPLESLRVIWLRLLDNATLRSLPTVCVCASAPPDEPFFGPISESHNPVDSLWVHTWPQTAGIPSDGWAEVTHCISSWRPMWFYVAAGSGLSVNVGRTLVYDARHSDTPTHYDESDGPGPGTFERLREQGYDSLQFVRPRAWVQSCGLRRRSSPTCVVRRALLRRRASRLHAPARPPSRRRHTEPWSPEERHELLMLRWPDRVAAMDVRCGRFPHLQPCTAAHGGVAMQQQCSHRVLADPRVRSHVRLGRCLSLIHI